MGIRIRRATDKDLDLLLWVMLAASRSHLDRGIWEYMNDSGESATLSFLRRLATTDTVHPFHRSLFLVAESDGEPGAAMCAYNSSTEGFAVALPEIAAATAAEGIDAADYCSVGSLWMILAHPGLVGSLRTWRPGRRCAGRAWSTRFSISCLGTAASGASSTRISRCSSRTSALAVRT